MTTRDITSVFPRQLATCASEAQARFLPDPLWLVRGNPEHPEHDVLGLRNPRGIQVPELVIIGGAQVYGDGLEHGQSWPAVLGRRMGGCVLNAGLPGWGSVQYAMQAEALCPLSPRRVIVCLTPASDLALAFNCARASLSPLARALFEPTWAALPHPDHSAIFDAGKAIAALAAERPGGRAVCLRPHGPGPAGPAGRDVAAHRRGCRGGGAGGRDGRGWQRPGFS
jgi:hypothetical protein